jgi:DNA-binding PadR family transcriptional regulator
MKKGKDDMSLSMWEKRLLNLLARGEKRYGLEMIDALEDVLEKRIGFSLVYPNLQKLEQRKFIVTSEGEESAAVSGAKRKYYEITEKGKMAWQEEEDKNQAMLNYRKKTPEPDMPPEPEMAFGGM